MGEYDSRRVEPRTTLVGIGMGVTPERIAEIEHRRRELEKVSAARPERAFGEILSSRGDGAQVETPSVKQKKLQALPRKGPRPALVHPGQRQSYGREQASEDVVILKG